MSADGHTVCPNCHPDLLGYTDNNGVIDCAAEDLDYNRDVRENYEFCLLVKDGELFLDITYSAECWECDWGFHHSADIPISVPTA